MKKIFVLMALSAFSLVSADKFMTRGCDHYSSWNGGYMSGSFDDQSQWHGGDVYPNNQSYGQPYDQNMQWGGRGSDQNMQWGGQGGDQNMQWGGQGGQMAGFQRVGDKLQPSDQDLTKKVHDALDSKVYQDLMFRVDGGVVTLRGPVDTLDNKTKAEDAVKKIDGVRHVNSQVAIMVARSGPGTDMTRESEKVDPKFANDFAATESDKQVNAKIRDKLNGGWFSKGYDALILRTNNGIVIITGTVDSQEEANKLNDHLKGIEGIRKVNVQVAVKKK